MPDPQSEIKNYNPSMDILFLVPYVPNLIRVRPYNLIRSLTARGHRVTVMTLSNYEEEDVARLEEYCHRVYAYDLPTWRSVLNTLAALPTSTPLQAVYSWQPALAKGCLQLARDCNGTSPSFVIHIEHLRGARYGLYLKKHLTKLNLQVPIIWDSVDCITHLFNQAAEHSLNATSRWLTRFELGRTRRYERFLVKQFDRTLVTSRVDKDAFSSLIPGENPAPDVSVLPNGVDLEYFTPKEALGKENATLVVSGKMSYHANVTMVMHLVNEIMPLVWARNPGVKLWIVGKDPPNEIKGLAKAPTVTVTGMVDDIRPYLQSATLAVAPIQYGAGVQNKVLEAMACGTPVISTSQAVSALDAQPGRDLLLADEPVKFAEAILSLLNDSEQQRRIAAAARRYVEQHHNWDHIATELEEVYLSVVDRKTS
ncbi:MAG: glycosyltransferase [Anaerolineales bacterium]